MKTKRKYNIPMVFYAANVGDDSARFSLPVVVVSEANQKEHWATKNKRKKNQQNAIEFYCSPMPRQIICCESFTVTFTKMNRGRNLDKDNLAGAFKHIQDAIAKLLRIDDGDPRIEWHYDQRKSKLAGIEIEVAAR